MPPLPQPRNGEKLKTLGRPTEFSLWPTKKLRAHAKIQPKIFALEPWAILQKVVSSKIEQSRKPEALACLRQAEDFYRVGTEKNVEAARPLALYYSYMNLLKVYCLVHGANSSFNNAQHGITEIYRPNYEDIILRCFPSPNGGKLQNFSEMRSVLMRNGLNATENYKLGHLIPQILPGHRIWCEAKSEKERFISLESIQFWRDKNSNEVWIKIYVFADDLSRLRVTHAQFLQESGFSSNFHEVKCTRKKSQRDILCFEQSSTIQHPINYPADSLYDLVLLIRNNLWATVSAIPPYRRYYAYLSPQNEFASRMPQILSIYALTYHLGSVTRYRPQDYDDILDGKFGARIQDFVTGQSAQFLYLIASEICQQELTRPSII